MQTPWDKPLGSRAGKQKSRVDLIPEGEIRLLSNTRDHRQETKEKMKRGKPDKKEFKKDKKR